MRCRTAPRRPASRTKTAASDAMVRSTQVASRAETTVTHASLARNAALAGAGAATACPPALARPPTPHARREPLAAADGASLTACLVRPCARPSVRSTALGAVAHSRAAHWPAISVLAGGPFARRSVTSATRTATAAPVPAKTAIAQASQAVAFRQRKPAFSTAAWRVVRERGLAIRRAAVAIWVPALAVNRRAPAPTTRTVAEEVLASPTCTASWSASPTASRKAQTAIPTAIAATVCGAAAPPRTACPRHRSVHPDAADERAEEDRWR